MGKACRSSHELARRGKAVFIEDRSEVLRIGIWNDLTLVADGRQKRLDELAMLEASGPASSTTPFFGCAVAISARVEATSSAATGWNLEGDI